MQAFGILNNLYYFFILRTAEIISLKNAGVWVSMVHGLQIFPSLMGFSYRNFAHFVHALHLFKALRLFFLTNFPGPTSILDSRVAGKS